MKTLVFSLFLVGASATILHARQDKPPAPPKAVLPSGPLLNKAPDFARWTVTSKTSDASPAASPPDATPAASPSSSPAAHHRKKQADAASPPAVADAMVKATTVVKTQSIRHEETTTATGTKTQKWCLPDMQVTMNGSAPPIVSVPGNPDDANYTDYSKADFKGFEWISKRNFTGMASVLGQECIVFKDEVKTPGRNDGAETPTVMVASINAATRLPVTLQLGGELRTYEFGLAPTAMLALPPDVAAMVEQWRKTMNQSALMPAKP